MARRELKKFRGYFSESEYESAFLAALEAPDVGWRYTYGREVSRESLREVLIAEDFLDFLSRSMPDVSEEDLRQIYDTVRLVGAESDFATLHKVHGLLTDGFPFTPEGQSVRMVSLIDFDRPEQNVFRAVNQFEVEYTDQGKVHCRIPDVLLFVNGIPLCAIELKNPANPSATIEEAWKQITIRYWRDIPHLLHYCPLACISDGVKTRLGTVKTPYEHFYAWRRVEDGEKVSVTPFDEFLSMVRGVFRPARFLELFRDYVYFQDTNFDSEEREVVCRYPQFFATRLLRQSIVRSVSSGSGKGGTYFGATGCGKTFTMAFLARQLSLRCRDVAAIGSPTVVMIVDRDELQDQGIKLFAKSREFLSLGEVAVVKSRADLRRELSSRESGGFYICTIQKFCDRKEDPVGLINARRNIICFSDEAHRTQIERARRIQFSEDRDENMRAMLSKPYAKVLREALPGATFVGFTGTPIAETYQTFGDEIDRYTMDQAVADGLTVPIKYHPRIAKVLLDEKKADEIEAYYQKCAESGATAEDIRASKKAMSSMEVILKEPSRLARLATDIHNHYTKACAADPGRVQKAMVVCANRPIAYALLKEFQKQYPEWFVEWKVPKGTRISKEEWKRLPAVPTIAMVASVSKNDPKEMYDYLGGTRNHERTTELDAAYKEEHSNFRIVIVVDMWITGFDVPCLTYLYNDKPLEKHLLVQTISRVNRLYPGKTYGMVIDYIGIRDNLREAMKIYGGNGSIAPTADDVEQAKLIFLNELGILKQLFSDYDLAPFLDPSCDSLLRYRLLAEAAEYVFSSTEVLQGDAGEVSFKTYFLKTTDRLRLSYDICYPSGVLSEEEAALAQCFLAVAGFVRKMSGTSHVDTTSMNRAVEKMVEEALSYTEVEGVFSDGEEENIYSKEYVEKLSRIRMPATRLEILIKLLRRQIREYGKVNRLEAKKFQEMLESTIASYHERRSHLSEEEAGIVQEDTADSILAEATAQAFSILREMRESRESFRKLGLTFEEKAFYDIILAMQDKHDFKYGEDCEKDGIVVNEKCRELAKKVKEIIDTQSSYSDWLNNQSVRNKLQYDILVCLTKNGYPPTYSGDVFREVMKQVENFEENAEDAEDFVDLAADAPEEYGTPFDGTEFVPNRETLAAFAEAEAMRKNPSAYQTYDSFDELSKDLK